MQEHTQGKFYAFSTRREDETGDTDIQIAVTSGYDLKVVGINVINHRRQQITVAGATSECDGSYNDFTRAVERALAQVDDEEFREFLYEEISAFIRAETFAEISASVPMKFEEFMNFITG